VVGGAARVAAISIEEVRINPFINIDIENFRLGLSE
jgi:hypothetical protein